MVSTHYSWIFAEAPSLKVRDSLKTLALASTRHTKHSCLRTNETNGGVALHLLICGLAEGLHARTHAHGASSRVGRGDVFLVATLNSPSPPT
jgi:hypothetical protein